MRATTKDSYGEEIIAWTPLLTVWASKADERGREYLASNVERAETRTLFRVRWRSDLKAQDRLICEGIDYDIEGIAEIGRRRGLELICKRVTA